ncbi:hypothetical protein EHQ12_01680 [Leptospira gomenensis]|uniref:Signal transduction histidine kinase internal region domain-containing protein n=1 Tax=Leptospira gomenensis TaxID=2484974 RepID=A0A5F1YSU6_9LEPT|nr:histidine kinase [Leptospira gomenensis]TGK31777.1 hypothetical protein EHQ17_13435 [Leptospira gomenensis]TGK41595.1 hypothetical protein EHQ07_16040 [Leptospira gomenensis]TGK44424.1 hypothetical protein EHQ12_01680 [Leptospira gomenensis]TGK61445.1 hypothetical protein EHQ13_08825 [Leptospira gomenensis]
MIVTNPVWNMDKMGKRGTLFSLFFDKKGTFVWNGTLCLLSGSGIYFSLRESSSPTPVFYFLILCFFLPFSFLLIFILYLALNRKNKEVESFEETENSASERSFLGSRIYNLRMTPHFLFNSLMTLRIYMEGERADAIDYLDSLSNMLRYSFRFVDRERVSISEELDFTLSYFDLIKEKAKRPFRILLKKGEDLELGEVFIPPFLIQTLVENSIKHAVLKSNSTVTIEILIQKSSADRICIVVRDDGPGAKIAGAFSSGTFFFLKRRLNEICSQSDLKIESSPGEGFKTEISFHNAHSTREMKKSPVSGKEISF